MMSKVVALLKFVGAVDGAVAVVASALAEFVPSTASADHAVMAACGTVGTVIALVAKFAASVPDAAKKA